MAIQAIAVDESKTYHLVIGLNRDNVESIRGEVLSLERGSAPLLTEDSDIVVIFGETEDEEVAARFPPELRPT